MLGFIVVNVEPRNDADTIRWVVPGVHNLVIQQKDFRAARQFLDD